MSEKLRLQEPIRSPLETPRLITPLPYRSGTSFLAWATVNNNQPVPDVFSKMTKIAASGRLGQVGSLAAALDLVQAIGRPGKVGVNADVLHLMRAGESLADLAGAPAGYILYGQLADGPALAPDNLDFEASSNRLLAGAGVFDLGGFVRALPTGCPISVEIPRNHAVAAGVPRDERVALAVDSVRRAIA
jgi:sugar phosphate isomerase/epimerase